MSRNVKAGTRPKPLSLAHRAKKGPRFFRIERGPASNALAVRSRGLLLRRRILLADGSPCAKFRGLPGVVVAALLQQRPELVAALVDRRDHQTHRDADIDQNGFAELEGCLD